MLKFFTYFFVCFYFLLSTGVTANFHFCKKGFKSFSINPSVTISCCKTKNKPCKHCKNFQLILKKSGPEKLIVQDNLQLFNFSIIHNNEDQIFKTLPFNKKCKEVNIVYQPPPIQIYPSINIRTCNFRI